MSKPLIILAPHWRLMDELFSSEALRRLYEKFELVWARNEPIPEDVYARALPNAWAIIAETPKIDTTALNRAKHLACVIEVSGAFPDTIDYSACAERNIEVLSCAPGFRRSVAEMGLGMALAGARGLIEEHEAFRTGQEKWLEDKPTTDFTVFGARIGFIGFGQIAQELTALLKPFSVTVRAHDPWLPPDVARKNGASLCGLEELAAWAQILFVTAVPTAENKGMLSAGVLAKMADHSMVIVLSRAHLVDFEALVKEAVSGRLRIATDVFPQEPLPADHPLRTAHNVILSPHRAAAVHKGRQLIGDMIADDLTALSAGEPQRRLARADLSRITALAGVGDAAQVASMAKDRTQ